VHSRSGAAPVARIVVALACLVCADVVLGSLLEAVGANPAWRRPDLDFRIAHPVYHHDLGPNVDVIARWGDAEYTMRTDELGLRAASVPSDAPHPSRQRLLVIGDSFVEGVGLAYEETFVAGLAARLATRGVEVVNAGVVSYSPSIYLVKTRFLVEERGLSLDAVLVLLDVSDIEDEAVYYRIADDGTVTREDTGGLRDALFDFVERNTILLSSLRTLARRLREDRAAPRPEDALNRARALWTHDEAAWGEYGERGLGLATERMNALARFLDERAVGLAIAVHPWPDQIVHGDLESVQVRHWRAWAAERGAIFIDLFPSFIGSRPADEVLDAHFIAGDVHWNARGHGLVARALGDGLETLWASPADPTSDPPPDRRVEAASGL
jgi:lysophospholipase L1-like esterase